MVDQGICCKYNFPMAIDKLNPRESMGFLTWKVARMITNDLAARFAKEGVDITVEQWRALLPLYKHEGLSQGRLCEILSQEKTGVSRLVAALERRGLVRREPSREDRRVKHIFITDDGRELVDSTVDIAIECRDAPLKDIDPDELKICQKVLWQIIEPSLCQGSECGKCDKKFD